MGKLNSAEQNQQFHGGFCDLPWKQTETFYVTGMQTFQAFHHTRHWNLLWWSYKIKWVCTMLRKDNTTKQHDHVYKGNWKTQQKPDKSELKTNDWGIHTGRQREPPKHQRRSQQTVTAQGGKKQIKALQSDLFLCLLQWVHKNHNYQSIFRSECKRRVWFNRM